MTEKDRHGDKRMTHSIQLSFMITSHRLMITSRECDLSGGSRVRNRSGEDLQLNLCFDRHGECEEGNTVGRGRGTTWEGLWPVLRSGEEKTGVCCLQLLFSWTITKQHMTWLSFTERTVNVCAGKGVRKTNWFRIVCENGRCNGSLK